MFFWMSRYDWNSGLYSSYWRFDSSLALYGNFTGLAAGDRDR
jgi:hypothetical protein